ncbi:MAG: carbohydrate ABC transporter permease [Hyphomicrobiales bacterium]|nr:MAG: carbohydrate ABC transporter permease [Hyphomicrobiales bacterium]
MATVDVATDLPRPATGTPNWLARIDAGRLFTHLALLVLVIIWTVPTAGLLISSLRDKDQLAVSGWWTALSTSVSQNVVRLPVADQQVEQDGRFVISGNVFGTDTHKQISGFGLTADTPNATAAGGSMPMNDGGTITVDSDGNYQWVSDTRLVHARGPRLFFVADIPPRFTLQNYVEVLTASGVFRSFVNSFTVTIPATIIPIMMAAFAAYALAWMRFPFRGVIVAVIVGLLVVPLQMSLIPLLSMYNGIARFFGAEDGKTYLGIWLAHTAFGLPLAIYLLRNYMAGLPKEIMESARIDGASHFKIFTGMVLPLSFPALASFSIFQFLWVWNDLLVAMVFLGAQESKLVLTGKLVSLLGSRGNNWEILTAGAFVTIVVPLIVFFSLQRYFVRGLLAGSVK